LPEKLRLLLKAGNGDCSAHVRSYRYTPIRTEHER